MNITAFRLLNSGDCTIANQLLWLSRGVSERRAGGGPMFADAARALCWRRLWRGKSGLHHAAPQKIWALVETSESTGRVTV